MLRSVGWPERYSVSTVVVRKGLPALRMASALATMSCAWSAADAAVAPKRKAAARNAFNMRTSHVAERVDDLQARSAVGGKERGNGGKSDEERPGRARHAPGAEHVELERHGLRLSGRQPGEPAHVHSNGDERGDDDAGCRAHGAKQASFEQELPADAAAPDAQRPRRADLIDALDHAHAHRIGHSEHHDDADDDRDEGEDR